MSIIADKTFMPISATGASSAQVVGSRITAKWSPVVRQELRSREITLSPATACCKPLSLKVLTQQAYQTDTAPSRPDGRHADTTVGDE
ncbi:hypothetical protein [Bradyrhizobium guangzhouense]|uniref:hypothetical protein n=1 Tax=Bradyrhizobium guangzhouense TaxID=1325095 RepID=UPI001009BBCC|nr:hypothetical protein [Bradyrhizobium guangzhouense]RXH10134.1 hypothetical protein EAS54_32310 [Bradyrhizobium guangzhouense]